MELGNQGSHLTLLVSWPWMSCITFLVPFRKWGHHVLQAPHVVVLKISRGFMGKGLS